MLRRDYLYMLCSVCNKNTAVIFINKVENGITSTQGLCYNCAKEKGINPLEVLAKQSNLSEKDLEDMSSQLESLFNDIADGMSNLDENDIESIGPMLGNIFSAHKNDFVNNESNSTPTGNSERKIGRASCRERV